MGFFENLSKKVAENSARRKEAKEEQKKQKLKEDEEYNAILANFKDNNATNIQNYYFDLVENRILEGRKTFNRDYRVIDFKDVLDFQVSQSTHNETQTQTQSKTKKKHGITRAVIGGAIAGGAGAIVGSITAKSKSKGKSVAISNDYTDHLGMVFYLSDGSSFEIRFIRTSTKNDSFVARSAYSQLNDLIAILNAGLQKADEKANNESISNSDSLDQIKKLKELLDMNAITKEEFDQKKKELLDL